MQNGSLNFSKFWMSAEALVQTILHQENLTRYGAWFAALKRHEGVRGLLVLVAPTRFHAGHVLRIS
jgi:hypothetical protein